MDGRPHSGTETYQSEFRTLFTMTESLRLRARNASHAITKILSLIDPLKYGPTFNKSRQQDCQFAQAELYAFTELGVLSFFSPH